MGAGGTSDAGRGELQALYDRLQAQEEELAFQSDSLRSLNDALARQQKDILLLQQQLALMAKELRDLRASGIGHGTATTGGAEIDGAESGADEKPPHY